MRNTFSLEVSFSESPALPYEWSETTVLTHVKLERVSAEFLGAVLKNGAIIQYKGPNMLICDTKEAVALRLSKDGHVLKRSFLKFSDALDVCEAACGMKESVFEYEILPEKISYNRNLSIEKEMKDYILEKVKEVKDVDFSKYLYYLYAGDIKDFSEDKLINTIKSAPLDENMKLYKFLIES